MSETKNVVIQQNNGTDYNKIYPEVYDKNVNLSTENASVWGSTLKDALPKINSRTSKIEEDNWKIGDIKISVKESLGDKWLKTDGSLFSKKDYPDLADICFYKGYPYGTEEITTSTVPGCAYFGRAINETNLNSPCSNYVNRYHFRFLFSRKVTEQGEKEDSHIMTYYYSPDLINWESNQFEIEPPAGTDTVNTSFHDYFNGIGYENGYWYFSFQFDSDEALFFYYGQNLAQGSWTKVEINESIVYDTNADRYSFSSWGGEIFYENNQWHTFVGLYGRYTDTYCMAEIISDNINFSSAIYQRFSEYFPENIYSTGDRRGTGLNGFVLRINNYIHIISRTSMYGSSSTSSHSLYYCGGTIGTTGNTLTKLAGSSNSQGLVNSVQIIKAEPNKFYFMWAWGSNLTGEYIELLPRSISSAMSYTKNVTFIDDNGTYVNYKGESNYIYVYTSNSPSMTDYTTQQKNIVVQTFIGNAKLVDKMCYFTNIVDSNTGEYTVNEIKFGGLLPNYTPTTSSKTNLNAFIKALN